MAYTYLILNVVFVLIAVALLFRFIVKPTKAWWVTLGALLLLTLIFDNVIIGLDIVAYDATKLLGSYLGLAPIEDFFYAILAVLIVPALWKLFTPKEANNG